MSFIRVPYPAALRNSAENNYRTWIVEDLGEESMFSFYYQAFWLLRLTGMFIVGTWEDNEPEVREKTLDAVQAFCFAGNQHHRRGFYKNHNLNLHYTEFWTRLWRPNPTNGKNVMDDKLQRYYSDANSAVNVITEFDKERFNASLKVKLSVNHFLVTASMGMHPIAECNILNMRQANLFYNQMDNLARSFGYTTIRWSSRGDRTGGYLEIPDKLYKKVFL